MPLWFVPGLSEGGYICVCVGGGGGTGARHEGSVCSSLRSVVASLSMPL